MSKSPDAFRTISEAAEEVGTPQHVLRFWETKFSFVSPVKRAGGRRFYRSQDILILKAIRRLLHDDGLTIRGVQRLHKEQGLKKLTGVDSAALFDIPEVFEGEQISVVADNRVERLRALIEELEAAKVRLDAVISP